MLSPFLAAAMTLSISCVPSQAETTPNQTPAASTSRSTVRAVPIKDYWDANAWDHSGGSLFWHALSDQRRSTPVEAGRNTRRPTSATTPARQHGAKATEPRRP
ncbi:MAG: hypothetical protein KDN20_03695 [Verrucomicrobiae bacterium]|nr:hypothetical protein [Verrucomicrobiae bacterium]